jgi:hypothetical protein|tara:strand:- start:279 stop:467 length:189 start_codon:yes stop_codon:yes gene_type:complete
MFPDHEQNIGGFPKKMETVVIDKERYVESQKESYKHKFEGWYWHSELKKFYRWDDLPKYAHK